MLKMNEPIFMQIGTSDPRNKLDNGMKRSTLDMSGGQAQGHMRRNRSQNRFRPEISVTIRRILTKPGRHILR